MVSASPTSRFATIDRERAGDIFARMTTELARPALEFGMLLADPVFWGWGVQRGDGHTVLALPGLGGGDHYLQPLRAWVKRVGYQPLESRLDVNPGWSEELADELSELVAQEYRRSGSRLTIIGHSLGGVLGYAIAARQPRMIRQIVTLASPLQFVRTPLPMPVPVTAFYSKRDSIVRYPAALAPDRFARNIEVDSSHIGMAIHPEVYRRLSPLLRQAGGSQSHPDTK